MEEVLSIPVNGGLSQTIYHSKDEKIVSHGIEPITPDKIPKEERRELTIHFVTPTKFIYEGKVLSEKKLTFTRNLFRRISNLTTFHGGEFIDSDSIRGLLNKSDEVVVRKNALTFHPWTRYSSRQKKKIKIHGFSGRITFSGDFAPFYPCIFLGQITHVGKSISMGMGMYKIE